MEKTCSRDVATPFATLALQNKVADFTRYRRPSFALGVGGLFSKVTGKQLQKIKTDRARNSEINRIYSASNVKEQIADAPT